MRGRRLLTPRRRLCSLPLPISSRLPRSHSSLATYLLRSYGVRFEIERELGGAAGLRAISEIPDLDPCLLEGPSGIGKTLAVRLLQLVAGEQPYLTDQQLWLSLRAGLGPTTIQIEGLRGDRRLCVRLEPDRWPLDVTEPLGRDLGAAWLDDEQVDVDLCAELLSVVRIAGTETPDETVRRSMSATQTRLRAAAVAVRPRLADVRASAGGLRSALRDVDPDRAVALREEHARLQQRAQASEQAAHTANTRLLELVIAALHPRSSLAARDAGVQEARERLASLEEELKHARSRQNELEREADAAREHLVRRGIIAEQQAAAEQTLQRLLTRLANRQEEIEAALRAAGEPRDLADELRKVADELAAVRAERADLDTDERAERLVGQLLAAVDLARREGLDDNEVLFRIGDRAAEAAELAARLKQRAQELAERPTPEALTRLDGRIAELTAQRRRLLAAKDRVEARDGQQQRAEEQRVEVERLRSQGHPDVQARLQSLLTELGAANEHVLTLAREAVRLRAELADQEFASAADAQRMLDEAVERLEVPIEQLGAEAVKARDTHEEAKAEFAAARQALRDAEHELRVAALAAERLAALLRERPELLAALNGDAAAIDAPLVEQIAAAVRTVDQRLTDATNTVAALAEAAGSLAQGEEVVGRLFAESFTEAVGERLRRDLDTPAIREALFDAQPLRRLDLRRRVLQWTAADGEPRERPLRAFSTGEQAFAFTQARIRELEPPGQTDRLLVLDEFGAFVSADRMHALADFLQDEEVQHLASQVLVILPQQVNYAAELAETRGSLRRRYEERVAQLEQRGYIALPLADAV